MVEANRREADFLHQGLPKIIFREIKGEGLTLAKLALSVLLERPRDFAADLEKLTRPLDQPVFFGIENIPTDPSPLIFAPNHPSPGDILLGAAFISQKFAMVRKRAGLPAHIRWFIAANIPQGKLSFPEKCALAPANYFRRKFIKTYDFIPVPVGEGAHDNLAGQRMLSFRTALSYLDGPSRAPALGIAPDGGGLARDGIDFYDGAGELLRLAKNPNLQLVPVGIFRKGEEKMEIRFGPPLRAETIKGFRRKEATAKIKEAISTLAA